MSYRLINANDLAIKYPEVNDMPCIYADLPKGLDGRYYGLTKRMQKWIPITERLPESDHYVLACDDEIVDKAFYAKVADAWFDSCGDKWKEVTAWMPLPKPYKEGEAE